MRGAVTAFRSGNVFGGLFDAAMVVLPVLLHGIKQAGKAEAGPRASAAVEERPLARRSILSEAGEEAGPRDYGRVTRPDAAGQRSPLERGLDPNDFYRRSQEGVVQRMVGDDASSNAHESAQRLTEADRLTTVSIPIGRGELKAELLRLGFEPGDGGVYIVRDSRTGQILKVGETRDVFGRFGEYQRRAQVEGRQIEIDVFTGPDLQGRRGVFRRIQIESDLRRGFTSPGLALTLALCQ